MNRSAAVDRALKFGRTAVGMTAWKVAYAELKAVEPELPPEGLKDLAKAAWWVARLDDAFAASESAYRQFAALGNDRDAGRQAVELYREYANGGQPAVAAAWLAKAVRHLEGAEDSIDQALLMYLGASEAFGAGRWDDAREALEQVVGIAEHHGDTNLAARSRTLQGMIEIQVGEIELGMSLLGEAAASVSAGGVDPKTAGAVMCNTISTCWDMADFAGAAEWTDNAGRWFKQNDVPGYPGICRVRRAEILALNGDWTQAEAELHIASDELQRYNVVEYLGETNYALGEIERRRGNSDMAITYFKAANEMGREPLPGYALVSAARGDSEGAIATLKRALSKPGQRMQRSRVLLPLVDLLIEAGDLEDAARTASELESLAADCGTSAMRAWAEVARAACIAAQGSLSEAAERLSDAEEIWEELRVPYEVASTRLRRAILRRKLGDRTGAELDFDAARSIFERLGATPDLERIDSALAVAHASASSTRAVLVTDIVGSTRLADVIGDRAWTKLLAWHDRVLVDLIKSYLGQTIDRTGDGYLATFSDVTAAASCAVEIQRALERQRTDHGFAPSVRIGVHAAEITEVDGSPAGAEVHRAARIGALAEADEIVVSRQAGEALLPSMAVAGWRSEEIRGFDEPVEVGTLAWGPT